MDLKKLDRCDILLYKGTGFTSKLIQWGTTSLYSHVALVVNPEMCLGIESNTGHQSGVRAIDLRKIENGTVDVFRIKTEFKFNGDEVISFLVDHLGAKFDFVGVTWLGVLKGVSAFTGFKKLKMFNQFQEAKDYFCSELVYEAFSAGGLDIVPQVDEADITSPGDIAQSDRLNPIVV